ncbi:hypothetical protein LCGC14_0849640 [marine sediment metagenome]|uniref:DUF551 domain-containing protein n=1 Tax=marine sediment metagenome TaxID=412755 RepID=A0A0F9RVJ6_9ZZZZ
MNDKEFRKHVKLIMLMSVDLLMDVITGETYLVNLAMIIRKIDKEKLIDNWISVSDNLPKARVRVLTCKMDREFSIPKEDSACVSWVCEDGGWYCDTNASGAYKPTHWMSIVLPPVEATSRQLSERVDLQDENDHN